MRDTILKSMERKPDLPPLPEIALKIQQMVNDPQTNARSIAKLIEVEPVLAGRILKLSNSAFYSRSTTTITTLPVAITKIGLNMLVKLVYSLKMTSLFKDSELVNSKLYWKHCLAVAIFTQSLSQKVKASQEVQDIAYLAGLMHDIGIMVFAYIVPKEYEAMLKSNHDGERPLEEVEMETFGIEHTELGALFAQKHWDVDERLALAIKSHHLRADQGEETEICSDLVKISNSICNHFDISNGISYYPEIFRDTSWDHLNLTSDYVDSVIDDIEEAHTQAIEVMGQFE